MMAILPSRKTSGTTVGVPTSGVLSGISFGEEEHSVLPQTDNQEAADIPVVLQQESKVMGGRPQCVFDPIPSSSIQPSKPPT